MVDWNEEFRDFNQGLSAARGVVGAFEQGQQIAARRRQAEKEQEDKDAFAAAELLKKVEDTESSGDKDSVRQLQSQFEGFSPRVKYHALGVHLASKQKSQELVKAKFQDDYRDAVGNMNKAKVYFQQGRDEAGMQALNSIMNDQLRDGNSYEIAKDESGGFRQIIKDRHGREIQSSPVTKDELYTQFVTVLRDPGEAFNAYQNALLKTKLENYKEFDSFDPEHTYVDKQGNKVHRKRFLDWETNTVREHWFNDQYKEIPTPDISKMKNLKEIQTAEDRSKKETKDDLDITGKKLGIAIQSENLKQEKMQTEKGIKSKDEENEMDRKRFDRSLGKLIEIPMNEAGLWYDDNTDMVYETSEDIEGKTQKVPRPDLLAEYKRKTNALADYIDANKKPGEKREDALRRIEKEKMVEAKKGAEKRASTYRAGGRGTANLLSSPEPEQDQLETPVGRPAIEEPAKTLPSPVAPRPPVQSGDFVKDLTDAGKKIGGVFKRTTPPAAAVTEEEKKRYRKSLGLPY